MCMGVPVTLTVLTGDGNSYVSGEEWPDDMQSTLARSEAPWQAGVIVWTRSARQTDCRITWYPSGYIAHHAHHGGTEMG